MKYKYTLMNGKTRIQTNARKYDAGFVASLSITAMAVVPVMAAKPTSPGCFGQDRAAWTHENGDQAAADVYVVRAGDNGSINRDYKTTCGGDPVIE